jgi:hypothetical protein
VKQANLLPPVSLNLFSHLGDRDSSKTEVCSPSGNGRNTGMKDSWVALGSLFLGAQTDESNQQPKAEVGNTWLGLNFSLGGGGCWHMFREK